MSKNIKIYTLTFQFAWNYGAILQAYALFKYLENLGHDVKVIDYWPDYANKRFRWYSGLVSKPTLKSFLLLPHYFFIQKAYDKFKNKHLKLTSKCTSKMDIEHLEKSDVLFVGSDQVWNPVLLGGFNDIYFLNFNYSGIKASYAASAGQDDFTVKQIKTLKSKIECFDFVSVREKQFCKILKEYGIEKAVHVLDPVFLLDSDNYKKLAKFTKKEKYILTYYTDELGLTDRIAIQLSRNNGNIPIYKIGTHLRKNNIIGIPNATIEEFLGLFNNAEYIVTSSFHGTAFSIIFRKQFFSVCAGARSNRLISLLESFNLMDRYIDSEECFARKEIEDINYKLKDKLMEEQINVCKRYIEAVLKEASYEVLEKEKRKV